MYMYSVDNSMFLPHILSLLHIGYSIRTYIERNLVVNLCIAVKDMVYISNYSSLSFIVNPVNCVDCEGTVVVRNRYIDRPKPAQ